MGIKKSEASPLLTPQAIRFKTIERMLEHGRCVDFRTFLRALSISPATLKRDIECLRDELGAPLHYNKAERGYRLAQYWHGVTAEICQQLEAL